MLLLGHRGCRGAFPENTLEAFDYALNSGCDGFEFDVRVTADAQLVVTHDARLRRRPVALESFEVLQQRCALPRRIPRRPAFLLADLASTLAQFGDRAWMDIELKVPGIEASVVELLRKVQPRRGFVLSSFRRSVIAELHRLDPSLPLGFIFDRQPPRRTLQEIPARYFMPHFRLASARRVREYHAAGKQVIVWTVNTHRGIRRLVDAGADGIISDYPEKLAAIVRGKALRAEQAS